MKKRMLSLLYVLALCLGLLPATALAAEEIKLFIGGQQITESGCYENKNGTWTKVDGTEPASGQFYYDAATATLTLNQAEISYDGTLALGTKEYYGSVIAYSPSADVSLNIVVSQGTSTITGKGGIRVESTTGNASLSIKGPGSLDVEPKGSSSGITLCSSKDMNLDIDGADVTASSPAHYGVYLISSTDASSTSTITVNNGSLTTGGNGHVGIYYYWSDKNNAGTSSLTVSGNAVVDTRNSKIMTNNSETGVQVGAGSDGNGGIVFNGKSGTVYGKVELQDDLEIKSGESLTIGKDASLTVPDGKTLTNNGTVTTEEGGTLTGTITGNQPPKITTESLNDGTVDTEYNQTLVASGDDTITWSSSDKPEWLTLNSDGTITGTPTAAGSYVFTVKAENTAGSASKEFSITIQEKPAEPTPTPSATPAPTATPAPAATPLPYYILHFNTMGGYPLADVTFGEGAPVELWPYNPTRPGYLFMGWYADEALTKPVSTVVLVRETTVYAKWAVDPAAQAESSGSAASGSSSGSGSKATATPSPTAAPTATPTATPEPTPTATPSPTPEATPESTPEESGDKGGFPVLPVALGAAAVIVAGVAVVSLRRRV